MENRNRDRENLKGNRERESGLGSTSSPGAGSQGNMDRSTRGGNLGSQSSNVGSQGKVGERSRDDESEIGSPSRNKDLESER